MTGLEQARLENIKKRLRENLLPYGYLNDVEWLIQMVEASQPPVRFKVGDQVLVKATVVYQYGHTIRLTLEGGEETFVVFTDAVLPSTPEPVDKERAAELLSGILENHIINEG